MNELLAWLEDFKIQKGHPLKILHIGNIANNAYLIAKFQRQIGVNADVLCHDYYHIMGTPEWEEVDFDIQQVGDQNRPNFAHLYAQGYKRPDWFVQGPLAECIDYLIEYNQHNHKETEKAWKQLEVSRQAINLSMSSVALPAIRRSKTFRASIKDIPGFDTAQMILKYFNGFLHHSTRDIIYKRLVNEYVKYLPSRSDALKLSDLDGYLGKIQRLRQLFCQYDLIQGYACEPIYPLLIGSYPYVAFEHGTLRDSPDSTWTYKGPFFPNSLGRLTALSYVKAGHVFITNADCVSSAHRLNLQHYEAMPHPIDEQLCYESAAYRGEIRSQFSVKYLFFCPTRHNWAEKGTDWFIRALPELRRKLGGSFLVVFTPWGQEVDKSKQLITDLGCDDLIYWAGPFAEIPYVRWLSAADVIFDQTTLPGLSGITPRALACGTPVISSYEYVSNAWMFTEAPVLYVKSVQDIIDQTMQALDPGYLQQYKLKARQWIETNHSSKIVLEKSLRAYQRLLMSN